MSPPYYFQNLWTHCEFSVDPYPFNIQQVYKERLKAIKGNETSAEETKKEKQQQKQTTTIQDDPQQTLQIITSNLKDQIQNIIKVNETTKAETMYDKLCDNLSNNLKTHVEKLLWEQLTIQIVDNSEPATPSEPELLQTPEPTTPQQKAGQQPGKKKPHYHIDSWI
ncbi:hypothetical protein CEXT_39981 [Caerostris extrusa]|uniref:Uncharacterized protein n=1 Tax=Caerostris extrusa TaxID=172846 RepID=A0AAV4MRJ3_CAEEX|nr:hypothetical protein CEXT_39981 [Caerostris extrusa]